MFYGMDDEDFEVEAAPGNEITHIPRARATPETVRSVRLLAQRYRAVAIDTLVDVCETGKDTARVAAAMGLLAYSDGKPVEAFERDSVTGEMVGPPADLSKLSSDELRVLLELTRKARS